MSRTVFKWIQELSDEELVSMLCEVDAGMNEWEMGFSDDMFKRVTRTKIKMNSRQRKKAEQILQQLEED